VEEPRNAFCSSTMVLQPKASLSGPDWKIDQHEKLGTEDALGLRSKAEIYFKYIYIIMNPAQ
jgi:hypothetical protein